jgi:TonB family protein
MAPLRRTPTPPTPVPGSPRPSVTRAPEGEEDSATVVLKAPVPPPPTRRPAAPAEPLPVEDETATVVVRGQGRAAASARPARAPEPEPESEEPATIVMGAAGHAGLSAARAASVDRAPAPPPVGRAPAPVDDETVTTPAPVLAEPRRSVMTLALAGVGLVLFLVLLTTALIVIVNRRGTTPVPSPSIEATTVSTPPPARTPPPVTKGVVRVESTPAGANVTVDGTARGTTPVDVHDLPLSAHEVKLELEGYAPTTESVMITAESPRTVVTRTLTRTAPATGTVDVSSTPAGAMVRVDGTSIGLTPLRGHKLNVGSHRVEISAEGYETASATARVKENTAAVVELTLRPKPAPTPVARATPAPPASPTPDPTVYEESNPAITVKPVKTLGKSAEYPKDAAALKRGQRASVTVRFVVLESGDVTDVEVVESAGATVDEAVVTAYRTWKFTPGMKQGAKVKVRVTRRQTFLGG